VSDDELTEVRREDRSLLGRAVSSMRATAREVVVVDPTRSIIEDLEPYLAQETVPRIVDAVLPHLIDVVAPELIDGLTPYLVEVTVPKVIDDVVPHLVEVTVPQVVDGITPELVDRLLPEILQRLRPHLEAELVPSVVDGVTRHIVDTTAPAIIDGLLPKIRADVVPAILDDIVDDPKLRELIREQSQGLLIDALERLRSGLAEADDVAERFLRWVARRRPVELIEPAAEVPIGRRRSHAGLVSRGTALAVDAGVVSFVATQALSATIALVDALFTQAPAWLVGSLTVVAAVLLPTYLTLCWWLAGRTLGEWLAGVVVVRQDGHGLGFGRSLARALVGTAGFAVWAVAQLFSVLDVQRRGIFDLALRTRTPYRVHKLTEQRLALQRARSAQD
jgi:uncharacterized RDD family membrane protein YckC